MRSQRGVFKKKCLADLIAFQYVLHSFSTVLGTEAHSVESLQKPTSMMFHLFFYFTSLISFSKLYIFRCHFLTQLKVTCQFNAHMTIDVLKILRSLATMLSYANSVAIFDRNCFVRNRWECNMEALCFVEEQQKTDRGGLRNGIR